MMVWNKVKEENSVPTIADMIETLMEKNRKKESNKNED
jgi:hypothetical protein